MVDTAIGINPKKTGAAQFVIAPRATGLIVAGCQCAPRSVVLLPALFCATVAEAIESAGLKYRCYDVPMDLSCPSREIGRSMGPDVGTIVFLHPFGLCRPPIGLERGRDIVILEDACHALRTSAVNSRVGSAGDLTVFSLRKEFLWPEGGLGCGPMSQKLVAPTASLEHLERKWHDVNLDSLAHTGLAATQLAVQWLGDWLPRVTSHEVLTMLPLKSPRRDSVIDRLRRKGVPAWRWIRRLKRMGATSTPQAWKLRSQLLLVPLPVDNAIEPTLESLRKENLQPWLG